MGGTRVRRRRRQGRRERNQRGHHWRDCGPCAFQAPQAGRFPARASEKSLGQNIEARVARDASRLRPITATASKRRQNERMIHELFSPARVRGAWRRDRSEEHTSELQSLMRISYAVFCLKQKKL